MTDAHICNMKDEVLEKQRSYLRAVLAQTGLDGAALAKKSGLSASTINRPLNDPEWPTHLSLSTLRKIADATKIPVPPDLLGGQTADSPSGVYDILTTQPHTAHGSWPNEVRRTEGVTGLPETGLWPRDVPIYGTAVGGDGTGEFYFNGETAGWAKRPPVLIGVKNSFAIYLSNDSMRPVFKPGRIVYVNPDRPPLIGDYVVVELEPENGERNGPALLKQLVRRTAKHLILRQLNPLQEIDPIPLGKVRQINGKLVIYRVVEPDEWLGD
jgi:phage repressor protein C with HTH and peptisase S24 domain